MARNGLREVEPEEEVGQPPDWLHDPPPLPHLDHRLLLRRAGKHVDVVMIWR